MKKFLSLITIILLPLLAMAQTQQGYVKTKGRLNSNGTVTPGVRLSGATVVLKGGSSVVSGANGAFSMKVPSNKYYLQNVKKNGYLLVDPEVLSKTYAYSTNPLVISMETPDEQSADKLSNERKIRRTLQRTLQQREDEIEALKEQNKISEEEYRKALQKIYDEQSKNEKLISEMAERYSKIDYDQISDFDREFNQYILNGELTKADSLLNTKGDINSHINQYFELQEDIKEKEKNLEKEKELGMLAKEDLANRCEKKAEMFKIEYKNDSVAYYLGLRASLDTTNVQWQLDAGEFIADYIADYDSAMEYFQRAMHNSSELSEDKTSLKIKAINSIAGTYYILAEYDKTIQLNNTALDICRKNYGEVHANVANCYNNIGMLYNTMGNYEKALEFYEKSLLIRKEVYDESHSEIAVSYSNIGAVYLKLNDFDNALKYGNMALDMSKSIFGENNPQVAIDYNNIGNMYLSKGDYEKAIECIKKSLDINLSILKENHPNIGLCYNNLGSIYYSLSDIGKALKYFELAKDIFITIYSENSPNLAPIYGNLGNVFARNKDYNTAMKYLNKTIELSINVYGKEHANTAMCYNNIGALYEDQGDLEQALDYYRNALDIYNNVYHNKSHTDIATLYSNIGCIYYKNGEHSIAIENLTNAINMYHEVYKTKYNLDIADCYMSLATIYYELNDKAKALECYEQIVDIRQNVVKKAHETLLIAYRYVGLVQFQLGMYEKAYSNYKNAIDMTLSLYGDEHPYMKILCEEQYIVCSTLAKEDKSDLCYEEFMSNVVIIANMVEGDTPANKQGLLGEYIICEYENWCINERNNINPFEYGQQLKGKPKTLILMKDGKISSHYFEGSIGSQFGVKWISKEEKQQILEQYRKWKGNQK